MRSREYAFVIRLNEKEHFHLERQLAASGLKREPFIRCLIMEQEIKPRPPAEWPELVRQLSAIGNNINQLARKANSENVISSATWCDVTRMQADIWEKVKGF